MQNALLFLPEIITLGSALLLFILALFQVRYSRVWLVSIVCALAATGSALLMLKAQGEPFAPGIYKVDLFSQLIKLGLGLGLVCVLLLSRRVESVLKLNRRELLFFLFTSTAGMMMLVSATELLTFYVMLEFSAYPLYIMTALHRRHRPNNESAIKYIIQGGVASAISLYAISLIFGLARTTYFTELVSLGPELILQPLFIVAVLLLLSGLLFKLAVFPFHFWAPDVYESVTHQVVTFIATSSKLAAIAVLCRLISLTIDAPQRLPEIFFIISLASMTLGNLAALAQSDLKRLLAWSTVAHAGYMMLGLYAFSREGLASALFYGLTYLPIALSCFVVVCVIGMEGDNPGLKSLSGLYKRSPLLAVVLLVGMFALAGLPPTVGFIGKWALFTAAIEQGAFWLVLLAALNSTIALFYYLRVIRYAWLVPPDTGEPLKLHPAVHTLSLASLGVVLFLGIYPTPVYTLVESAIAQLLG